MAPALQPSEVHELPAMLTTEQVLEHFQICKPTLYAWMDEGSFPRPERIGRRLLRWNAKTLNAWIEAGCPAVEQGT